MNYLNKVKTHPLYSYNMHRSFIKCFRSDTSNTRFIISLLFSIILIFSINIEVSAENNPSKNKVSIQKRDITLLEVLSTIKSQTDYLFVCDVETLNSAKKININLYDAPVKKVLDEALKEQSLTYTIYDNTIIIKRKNEKQNRAIKSTTSEIHRSSSAIIESIKRNESIEKSVISIREMDLSIKGTVTDERNSPMPGVSVIIKGTQIGTATDSEGNFVLNVPDNNSTLVFSYVGYLSQEVIIGNKTNLEISLSVDERSLEELVVVGYSTQKKTQLTGSVSVLDTKTLQANPVGNLTQAMQGQIAGISVTTPNTPGGDAKIRIRGLGTINNNNPLWVIDGVPRTGGLNEINPSDIQSLTVLKDASSTAIYGARGANGVILVTTLQGKKSQDPVVRVSTRFGKMRNTKRYDLLDVDEFGEMLWLQAKNSGLTPSHPIYGNGPEPRVPKYLIPTGADNVDESLYDIVSFPITYANPNGTDWYSEMYNDKAMTKEHSISVTGGSNNTTYGISAGTMKEDGIIIKTGYNRYTFRANVATKVNKWLEIGENLGISHTNNWGNPDASGDHSPFGQLIDLTAIMPVYDIQGNWAPTSRMTGIQSNNNPIARLHRREDFTRKNLALTGNAFAKISILDNLSIKSLLGVNLSNFHSKSPSEPNPESYVARPSPELSEQYSQSRQWNWTNTLDYAFSIRDKHNFNVLLGTESINNEYETLGASRNGFFLTSKNYWVMSAGEGNIQNSGSASDWSTFSTFGRINYEFANKYLFDATIRRDGSSRFGRNNRYGTFPAFSLGWIMSEENFLSNASSWLDYLKVRASWGKSGNDQIGNYNGFTTFTTSPITSYYPITGSNSTLVSGFESAAFGNPNAKWETTATVNFGLDVTVFKKFDLTLDLWERNTTDMLYQLRIPYVEGLASVPSVNIGNMRNRGFDISLSTQGKSQNSDFRYQISTNISHYRNKIMKLSDNEAEAIIGTYTRAEKGRSFPEFFGYNILGIFQSQEEADNHPKAFGQNGSYNAPGRFKIEDTNGDNVINDQDRTYLGSPHPDFTAGLNINLFYKQFDIASVFYTSVGNKINNMNRLSLDFNYFQKNRGKRRLYESWGSPYLENNEDATMPIAEISDAQNHQASSYFIENGSFLRLQSLQVGYTVPNKIASKIFTKNVRVYVMVTNLLTFSKYSGLDPQIQSGDGTEFGTDWAIWPAPKRFILGINFDL